LKAAVRYLRYNEGVIPGSTERIFTFGMSGGGAQSALMGATGDSELYTPYLEAIGAVSGYSDAVAGAMCWCPITNLDYADEAYEWNLGSSRTNLTDDMQQLSDGMAAAFASYINELSLTDSNGEVLVLTESEDGIYQAGSYYDYLKSEIERSLNNFLSDTAFPYTSGGSTGFGGGMGGMMGGRGQLLDGDLPDGLDGQLPDGIHDQGGKGKLGNQMGNAGGYTDANGEFQNDGIARIGTENSQTESKTYETAQDYIDDLNADGEWVIYDSTTNTVTITSIQDFVADCKTASKSVGAFDDLNGTQGENTLFGYGDGAGAHFDPVMAQLLQGTEYGDAYASDLTRTDAQDNTVDVRVDMYNPMYYLCDYYDGYQTSNVATYWRIRTGINQGDTALTTEVNLTLALESYGRDVDFETVWGQGHTMAERTGTSTENFIQWVNECLQA
jgi:acetyl esterase/lipase